MKRNYKIIAMLLLIINIFTCFIPTYFYQEGWVEEWPGWTQRWKVGCNMFDVNTDNMAHSGPAYTFACFMVVCWVACIVVILYSIIRNKDHKLIGFAPSICLVPFFLFIRYVNSARYNYAEYGYTGGNDYSSYSVNWMFYISLALQIAAAAMIIIAMYSKDAPVLFFKKSQNVSEADELRKYKELLDSGAITQEEFDAKKKQILGL